MEAAKDSNDPIVPKYVQPPPLSLPSLPLLDTATSTFEVERECGVR